MLLHKYSSPDGLLHLVVQVDNEDYTIGFENSDWHTHGDLLVPHYGLTPKTAMEVFVQSIVQDQEIIALAKMPDEPVQAWITDDPESDAHHRRPEEGLSFRYWSGKEFKR